MEINWDVNPDGQKSDRTLKTEQLKTKQKLVNSKTNDKDKEQSDSFVMSETVAFGQLIITF